MPTTDSFDTPAVAPPMSGSRPYAMLALTLATLLVIGVALLLTYFPALKSTLAPEQRLTLEHIESARGTDSPRPPADGWEPVTLPDAWNARWPGHNGTVWYRLRFTVPEPWTHNTGLMVEAMTMAGALWLDGIPIWRDLSLREPLTRSWNQPRYWPLGQQGQGLLAQPGPHELLVRIEGQAAYQGGLGTVTVGDAAGVQRLYQDAHWSRIGSQQVRLGIQVAITLIFLMVWICWPRESLFGWYALTSAFWGLFGYNNIAASPWPFERTAAWQIATACVLWGFVVSFTFFSLRFSERRLPRTELALALSGLGIVGLGWACLRWGSETLVAQAWTAIFLLSAGLFTVCVLLIWHHAWVQRSVQALALAIALFIPVAAAFWDMGILLGWIDSDQYYAPGASMLFTMGIALVLAWRLRSAFEREAFFTRELRSQVETASAWLTAALGKQRDLEVASARQSERLELVRDLHDGLGGTLTSAIAQLQTQPGGGTASVDTLQLLRQINDDLRLIINSAGKEHAGELPLMLASMRRRLMSNLEACGIAAEWRLDTLGHLDMRGSRALHVLRVLQEAVTNVARHSRAHHAWVEMEVNDGNLRLTVRDDGVGFASDPFAGNGMGMFNMRQRAALLGGELRIDTRPGAGTTLTLTVPLTNDESRRPD